MVEQTINIPRLIEYLGLIMTIIISAIVVARAIKKGYQNYVENKLKVVDMRIESIEKEFENSKEQNEKEHDRLTLLFDKINDKLDRLLEKKSA